MHKRAFILQGLRLCIIRLVYKSAEFTIFVRTDRSELRIRFEQCLGYKWCLKRVFFGDFDVIVRGMECMGASNGNKDDFH